VVTLSVEVARAWRLGGVGVARCGGVARRLSAISKEAEAYLAEARKLRAEAARLEAELAAMRAREIDRVFEWAEPVDGKVTAAGLQRALTRHFVEENWNERDAARAAGVLESVERLERFASTRSSDGLLRRHDLDTPSAMRLELERLRRLEHRPRRREAAARRDDEPRERAILAFERQANRTGAVARLGAVACYVLPTLEGAAWTASCFDGVPLISAVFDSLAAAYRAVSPLGPLAGLVVVVNLALAVSTPRLVRFAANHAVVLDLLAALGLPRCSGRLFPALFHASLLLSVLAALAGKTAKYLPLTGYLGHRLTASWDTQIRAIIAANRHHYLAAQQDPDNSPDNKAHTG